MHGGDRRLERIRTDFRRGQRSLHKPDPFGDLLAVPERSILILKQDDFAALTTLAHVRATSCNSISANSPIASGSGSNSTSNRPRRIASLGEIGPSQRFAR